MLLKGKTKQDVRQVHLDGQAGVYTVASRLCLLGHVPSFPAYDYGVDLVLENGLRLQVKCAHGTYIETESARKRLCYPRGAYIFNLRRGWRDSARGRTGHRPYAGVADFFVLWGIEDDRFFIVPTSIKNRIISFTRTDHITRANSNVYLQELRKSRVAEFENRWDILDVNSTVDSLTLTVPSAGDYVVTADVTPVKEN